MRFLFLTTCLLFVSLSFTVINVNEEKHTGKITTALGTYEGEFNIKLNDENKGMIEIKVADVKKKAMAINSITHKHYL